MTSTDENVFYLSEKSKQARICYDKVFYVHSHQIDKPNGQLIKPIILSGSEMKELVELLPSYQKKMQEIIFEMNEKINEDARDRSAGLVPKPEPKDREYLGKTVRNRGIYSAKMTLSTYKMNPYIWLKLYFLAEEEGKEVQKCCHGGSILNDVDPVALSTFVESRLNRQADVLYL